MSKLEKLMQKLETGSIDGKELRSLLSKLGWNLERVRGSHEVWCHGPKTFVLATHGNELKPYQIREAKKLLVKE